MDRERLINIDREGERKVYEKEIRQNMSLESKKEMKGSDNSPAPKIKRSNKIILALKIAYFQL